MTNLSEPFSGQPGRIRDGLAVFASTRGHYYGILLAIFCAVFIISNIAATKVISFGFIVTDGGAFLFPVAYILGDILSEVYGFKAARKAIIIGFALQLLAVLVFFFVMIAPPGPGYENQSAFEAVLGFFPRIVAASLVGFLVGQLLNSYILVRIKRRVGESKLWVRIVTSTLIGEFIDTLLFCLIAFLFIIPGQQLVIYIAVGFAYKCLVEFACIPLTYYVSNKLKRNEPTYDLTPAAAR